MNRVTLLVPRQLGLFGEAGGPLWPLFAVEYEPEVTLFQETLESHALEHELTDVLSVVRQSYRCDGEGWVLRPHGAECMGFVARVEEL